MTIKATIIADSVSPAGIRLATVQCRYPKFIHGEVMTHRVFSRNASSSRAIPVERLIKDVIDDPVVPTFWGKNQPGMQAPEECDSKINVADQEINSDQAWDCARNAAIFWAQAFAKTGYHKQIVNRILEPFCHINTLITSTEWSNFFALRCHPDAQPEMRALADAISLAMANSKPQELKPGQWHLPYVNADETHLAAKTANIPKFLYQEHIDAIVNITIRASVARCARVSYLTQNGKQPNIDDDLKLYNKLVGSVPLHASPAEHQATPDELWRYGPEDTVTIVDERKWGKPHLHGNFNGWIQYRKTLPNENQ